LFLNLHKNKFAQAKILNLLNYVLPVLIKRHDSTSPVVIELEDEELKRFALLLEGSMQQLKSLTNGIGKIEQRFLQLFFHLTN
jgi:hypothetical protein